MKYFLKLMVAFTIACLIQVFLIHLLTGYYPSGISLAKMLGSNLVWAVIAFLIATLASKKGRPASLVIFTLSLVALEFISLMHTSG